jgi:heptosyltransferase I
MLKPTVPASTPGRIALVRFSALGDLVLTVPLLHALRQHFPQAGITLITSPLGHALLQGMPGVQFEVFAKPRTLTDYRAFYRAFRGRNFDVVLALQANLRINLLYPALKAPLKIGFDRERAREGQWLFCNQHIEFVGMHLADSFLEFAKRLGVTSQMSEWGLPLAEEDRAWAQQVSARLPRPLIVLHPCSSKGERNWLLDRYAEVVRVAQRKWNCSFAFTGGNNALEREYCDHLARVAGDAGINLCGKTTPRQLAALLQQADGLIAPDTAAVHLARAVETPVLGLYAVASPELSGPHQRMDYVVNRYPDAVRRYLGRDATGVPWNTRVHHSGAMALITVDDVIHQLERLLNSAKKH